jgi:outer membrane protein, multidrug efflux system
MSRSLPLHSAWRPLPLALLCVALAGCGALAPAAPRTRDALPTAAALPQPATGSGLRLEAGLAIDRWWPHFNDAGLERLVDAAMLHNADLAAAAARVRAARAQLDERDGARGPALQLEVDHQRARQANGASGGAIGSRHTAQIAGRYELDLWGRLAAGSESAKQTLLAQQWAQAALQWSLSAQVADTWFTLRGVERQVQISLAMRASRAETLRLRRLEQSAGAGSEFDLRRAEAELASTDVTLTDLQRQRQALQSALALLAGAPAESIGALAVAAAPLDTGADTTIVLPQGAAAELLRRRPDLRRAEAELAAAEADINAARAATMPALQLGGAAGSDARRLSQLFDGPGFVWSVAMSATQILFDGGQARARVRGAEAQADELLARYRGAVAAAVTDLRDAYAELHFSEQAQQAERQRVTALQRARSLAQLGVRQGALSALDLLDAERQLFQAQLSEVDAARDRLRSQVTAFKAVGGGWRAPMRATASSS